MLDSGIEIRSKHWEFTFGDFTKYQLEEMEEIFDSEVCTKFIFSETILPPDIPSLHGYVVFKSAKKFDDLKKIFRLNLVWKRVTNIKACIRACVSRGKYKLKNIKSYEMRDTKSIDPHFIKDDILDEEELYEWQRGIIKIINTQADDRTIHWYWDPDGCTGKSVFAKYLHQLYGACIIYDCEFEDIASRVYNHTSTCDLVVIDIPRNIRDYVSYTALDYIKNGILVNPTNNTETKTIASPHVIVFSNFEPQRERLSLDRWSVVKVPTW